MYFFELDGGYCTECGRPLEDDISDVFCDTAMFRIYIMDDGESGPYMIPRLCKAHMKLMDDKIMGKEHKEVIVSAAIQLENGSVSHLPPPNRHHHIIRTMSEKALDGVVIQGFLTDTGRFVTRCEAMEIALNAGQIKEPKYGKELFSEDLF